MTHNQTEHSAVAESPAQIGAAGPRPRRHTRRAVGPAEAAEARRWLLAEEAADRAGVHPKTVLRWCTEGRLRSSRPIPTGSGRRYIDAADLDRLLAGAG